MATPYREMFCASSTTQYNSNSPHRNQHGSEAEKKIEIIIARIINDEKRISVEASGGESFK